MQDQIIIVAPSSVHTQRYLNGISAVFKQIIFITNYLDNSILPSNVTVHLVNFKLTNIKARFQIAKIIQGYPNILVHIHQANSYAYHTLKAIKLAKLPCKTILTTWGSDILVLPTKGIWLRHMVKFNLNNSDIITSDSLYMSAKIKELCPTVKNLHTINFGMQHFPSQVDLSYKENLILSNRLHKTSYHIDKIIQAYAKLIHLDSPYKDFKLVITASGEETENLKSMAITLGINHEQIIFCGMLGYNELVNYYKRAKVFISIPDSDACSLSVLEAIGYGCYPILSNLPANLEWVIDDYNGIINQNSAQLDLDLVKAITYTSNTSKYLNIAEFNHTLIKSKGVFEDNMVKFIELYKSCI